MGHFVKLLAEYGFYLGVPLAFLAIVVWIYRPSAKKRYQTDGNIPFPGDKDDDKTRQGDH
jgi:cbb3-type cytochrome oxidase subunit 3